MDAPQPLEIKTPVQGAKVLKEFTATGTIPPPAKDMTCSIYCYIGTNPPEKNDVPDLNGWSEVDPQEDGSWKTTMTTTTSGAKRFYAGTFFRKTGQEMGVWKFIFIDFVEIVVA